MKLAIIACLFGCAAAASIALEGDLALSFGERPVMKVVRLLQDTKVELEKELEDDKAVHER